MAGIVFLSLALAGRPLAADAAPGEPPSSLAASSTTSPAPSTAESTRSLALKLAPGAHLVEKADGTLTVVEHWDSLSSVGGGVPGLALEEPAGLDRLGIRVLEPASPVAFDAEAGVDLESAARRLGLMPGVLWAEVSYPIYACLEPNDPMYPPSTQRSVGQWGPKRVGLPEAWDITTGSADVTLAVIDTGINPDIYDFSGRIVSPYSAINQSVDWPAFEDHNGHGTAVAGVAVARGNDGQAMAGAAWNVSIMPVKISESGESDTTVLSQGIIYAADNGADIINISFSGGQSSQTLTAAVAYAVARGVVIVAAAGNQGESSVGYPAALPNVIAVGATDSSDKRWVDSDGLASNMGSDLDLVAPGKLILSYTDAAPNSFGYYRGTSLSTPLVAGVAALMRSVDPALTPQHLTAILTTTADDLGTAGWDVEYGWGLVDAEEAVAQAADGEPPTTTTTTTEPTTTTTTTETTTTTTSLSTTTTVGPTTTTLPRFADVNESSTPYWEEIEFLASMGIVSGSSDGLFYPKSALLRQQFAKVIVLALDYPVSTADVCPFGDVQKSAGEELYPDHYVAVAYNQGITNGTNATHFSPYRTLTRAQMITMVARAAGLVDPPAGYRPPFPNFSSVHYPYARAAAYAGLLDGIVGMGAGYDFLAPANRGEICALVYALLQ
ncbi:MAG: S8 family serine peptidase [Thermoleophilia bacterium]|nr:S8 family serine peptidase [Thermoleophilia bacterium]